MTPTPRWLLTYTDVHGEQEEEVGGPRQSAMRIAREIKADIKATVRVWRFTPNGWLLDDKL
jgi:hypothetical protein